MKRLGFYLLCLATASIASLVSLPADAATSVTIKFDAGLVRWGKTLTLTDGAKAGIFPQALNGPATVSWSVYEDNLPTIPANRKLLGHVYQLKIAGTTLSASLPRPLAVAIPFGQSYWIRQVWVYDLSLKQWRPLQITLNADHTLGQAETNVLNGLYAILEDRQQQEGVASWYCKVSCSASYPTMHAASNDWPLNAMVRVRSLETGRTVEVKIVSRWGQPEGRIIDLSGPAYEALGVSNAGLTKVNVQPVSSSPQVLGAAAYNLAEDIIPRLRLDGNNGIPFPYIRPRPFFVWDQTTGSMLAMHRSNDVYPIASITKLMTAAVFLDTKTDLNKVITYEAGDETPYAYLRVKVGDQMKLNDLFYSMLVGSANNAATALARGSGLSNAEFLARMNNKAKAWGLNLTKFYDVTGLDTRNVSTAEEVARMTAQIMHEYGLIRTATIKSEYNFTTINTGVSHRIVTTDKLIGWTSLDANLTITGSKTGYLDESKYNYVLRTAAKNDGRQIITVIFGSATSSERFNDAAKVANWAIRNHRWSAI